MRSPQPVGAHTIWPRAVGALAMAVLGACGLTVALRAPPSHSAASLAGRSNWALAAALPKSSDFPADWGYGLAGELQRSTPTVAPAPNTAPQLPSAAYGPPACGSIPRILDHREDARGPHVTVDRYKQLVALEAGLADADATGERHEIGPYATFMILVVRDGPAEIAEYAEWLRRCGSYRVTNFGRNRQHKNDRTVTTVPDDSWPGGADAAISVTRSFVTVGSQDPPSTYHVAYYALRGIVLECSIYMEGPDVDVAKRLATATIQKLRAL